MRLVSLDLLNYRRFRAATLEVPDGVVGLVGRNGAGKSTLIEAVGWALYGHDAARTKKDQIKRRGAAPGDDCRVTLRFVLDGHRVEVVRELRGTQLSPNAVVTVDGVAQVPGGAGSMDEATAYLTRLLHLDRDSFFTSVVARQKELNALSDMRPGERKETVLRMLGVDAVDEAIRRCRDEKRGVRASLASLDEILAERPAILARQEAAEELVATAGDRARTAAAEAKAAEAEAADLRERHDALAGARDRYEEARARRDLLAARFEALETRLGALRRDLAELDAVREELEALSPRDAAYAEARERVAALDALRDRHRQRNELEAQLAEARDRTETLRERLEAIQRDLHRGDLARRMLDRVRKKLEAARTNRADLGARRARLQGELERHRDAAEDAWTHRGELLALGVGSPCPTCEQPLDESHLQQVLTAADERLQRHATALGEGGDAESALALEARTVDADLVALAERERELLAKESERTRLQGTHEAVESALDEAQRQMETLATRLEETPAVAYDAEEHQGAQAAVKDLEAVHDRVVRLQARLERREGLRMELQEREKEAIGVRTERTDADALLRSIGFDPEVHAQVVEAYEEARSRAEERGRAHLAADAEVQRAELVLQQARRDADRLDTATKRAEAERERLRYLDRLAGDRASGLLVDFKLHLVGRIRPVLGHHASELFRELTDGRYAALELDEGYDLQVHDEGERYALRRFSGGETDLANLCLRLAVGELMAERSGDTDLGFLALDEVFGSQDAIRRGSILHALAGLAGRFRQILVVTHVEEVRESVDHALRVVEDDDGTSRIEVVDG